MTIQRNALALSCSLLAALAISCSNGGSTTTANRSTAGAAAQTAHEAHTNAQTAQQQPQQPLASEPAATIPNFTFFILKSGIRFTNEDLAKTGNIVFILFDPTCSHCQHEASDIGKNYDQVKDVNFYFVSMNDPALMASFLDTWAKPLVGKKNVEVLYDRSAEFINKFHVPSQFPATYVYGSDGQLKTYWNGERPVEEIIAAINN